MEACEVSTEPNVANTPAGPWRPFDPSRHWYEGAVYFLWEQSWLEARLAVCTEVPGEWHYQSGAKVGAAGEAYPTHIADPVAPPPPRRG